jgi:hypothetical protein
MRGIRDVPGETRVLVFWIPNPRVACSGQARGTAFNSLILKGNILEYPCFGNYPLSLCIDPNNIRLSILINIKQYEFKPII